MLTFARRLRGAARWVVGDPQAPYYPGEEGPVEDAGPVAYATFDAGRVHRPTLGAASALRVEVITRPEALPALRAEYERLNQLRGNILPFALHDWHVAWCTHFLSTHGAVRDEPRICAVRSGAGECVAVVPLVQTARSAYGVQVTSLGLLGADQAITEIRTPLVAPGYESRVAGLVQRRLAAMGGWDWVHWCSHSENFMQALAAGAALEPQTLQHDYILDLPPSWEELRAGLKRNIRESLRHCYNSLKRDRHAFQFVVASEPQQVQAALERFLRLHALRARQSSGVAHPDHFASGGSRAFLRDVCARLARRGVARVFELVIGDEVIASRIGFVVGGSLYLYYSGFDPLWGRYSVMTTVLAESIKYAIAQGLKSVNLSTGADVGKTRWGPREVPIMQAMQVSPRLRSRMALTCFRRAADAGSLLPWLQPLLPAKRQWD